MRFYINQNNFLEIKQIAKILIILSLYNHENTCIESLNIKIMTVALRRVDSQKTKRLHNIKQYNEYFAIL